LRLAPSIDFRSTAAKEDSNLRDDAPAVQHSDGNETGARGLSADFAAIPVGSLAALRASVAAAFEAARWVFAPGPRRRGGARLWPWRAGSGHDSGRAGAMGSPAKATAPVQRSIAAGPSSMLARTRDAPPGADATCR
jgi:hypothetical protein